MHHHHRFYEISAKLIPLFIRYQLTRNNPNSPKALRVYHDIRMSFEQLGPTFVKLGQLLSARPDIVGISLAEELRNLLDNEKVLPYSDIEEVLTKAWGKNPKEIVRKIEHTPLATASIAQVHRATLHSGHVVAIKVQRPGIAEVIRTDLAIFCRITWLLDKITPIKGLKFSYLYKEFSEWITQELDFQVEGRRADKFKENMKNTSNIEIAHIYWEYSTQNVLVMTYLEGYTINHILQEMASQKAKTIYDVRLEFPINPDLLINHLVASVAQQAFTDKFFHGDLHPANIIVQKKNTIAFVDFGIIGTLNNEEQTQILLTLLAIVDGDPQALVKILTSLIAQPLSQQELAQLHQAFADELRKLHEDENGKISLNHFITVFFTVAQKYYFVWNSGFLLAVKTIGQLDTLCQLIGLRTSVVQLIKPHIDKAVSSALTSTLSQETLFKTLLDLLDAGKKLPATLTQLEEIINSGSFAHIEPSFVAPQGGSLVRKSVLLGTTVVIAAPLISLPMITSSTYRILLSIAIPLLLFFVLVKIFTKEGR